MAEDLVEEDAARPAGKDGRPGVGVDDRRLGQRQEVGDHAVDRGEHLRVAGQLGDAPAVERLVARQLHTVVGLGDRRDHEPVAGLRGADAPALARGVPARLRLRPERGPGLVDVAVGGERRAVAAHFLLPGRGVEVEARRLAEVLLGRLAREVGGAVFLLDLDLHVGRHARQLLFGFLVRGVGAVPEDRAQGVDVVVERNGNEGEVAERAAEVAAHLVGVVELVVAHPEVDVEQPRPVLVFGEQGAERSLKRRAVDLGDLVAQEIRRLRLVGERCHRPLDLLLHGCENGVGARDVRRNGDERRQRYQKRCLPHDVPPVEFLRPAFNLPASPPGPP